MSNPQYPGGYTPYPANPVGGSAPSGATAITAGVLAGVGAVSQLFGGALNMVIGIVDFESLIGEYDTSGLLGQSWFRTWAVVSGVVGVVTGVLLGVGTIALFKRKQFGRMLIVVGCAVAIMVGIAGFAINQSVDSSWNSTLINGGSGLFSLIFPIATAILLLVPATSRWLAHVPGATAQYGPYPPQAAQFPSQPGPYGVPPTGQQPGAAVPDGQNAWQQPSGPQAWGVPVAPENAWSQPPTPTEQAPWQASAVPPAAGRPADAGPTQVAPWQQTPGVQPAAPTPADRNGESTWKPAP
ncbi:hypothetical protein [Nocardia altamirensis]|uniref:hypothetical protein n=1 Tax=Nocardia altamirensis TaxID=472158 RepID=UPI00083FDB44|nr:hypothetical protein [Nocardia altamirensis]